MGIPANQITLFGHHCRAIVYRRKTFGQVLEGADELSPDEQENLVSILLHRLREQRRAELVASVKAAREEYRSGRCRPASPAQIMKRVLP
jgi:hypothetical protein